jgi:ribosomal protein S18 acetylase RimI-like enzyme
MTIQIRALQVTDRVWVEDVLVEYWGSSRIVTRGHVHQAHALPGFVAVHESKLVGLLLFRLAEGACEIISLNSLREGLGIGSALIEAVKDEALSAGCERVWLVTTNDNLTAQRFYQKRGFTVVAVHEGAVDRARALKPEIPTHGEGGIPIRDEIELEMVI